MFRGKAAALVLIMALASTTISGCKSQTTTGNTVVTQSTQADSGTDGTTDSSTAEATVDKDFSDRDKDGSYDESSAVKINLNSDKAEADGAGVSITGSTVTISKEGTYLVSGTLDNGQIIVDAVDTDKVQIVLANAGINCETSAAIYVKSADKVFVTLADGTTNKLSGGTEYIDTDDNTVDGVIFSKEDLTVNGTGNLEVNASYKHGIVSKDTLAVTGGNISVNAISQCLAGKDEVKIMDGTFLLTTSGKAVRSSNEDDTSLGNIYVAGGTFTVNSKDDSFHASKTMVIDGGTFTVESGDDAFHADQDLVVNNGTISVTSCYEGLEAYRVSVNGGEISIQASDDGINAAQPKSASAEGQDTSQGDSGKEKPEMPSDEQVKEITPRSDENQSGTQSDENLPQKGQQRRGGVPGGKGVMGGGQMGGGMETDTNAYIKITGGTVYVDAGGDGLDSNGSLLISGGMVYVTGPVSDGDGAIDYNGDGIISGGTVIAVGSSGMAQGFVESSIQCSVLHNLTAQQEAGTVITLKDKEGNELICFTPEKKYSSIVISSPKLQTGSTYTLTAGSEQAELTLESVVTSNAVREGGRGSMPPGNNR
ncbi:carbohydrate-binding domain-containing protein [Bacteroides xylanolyticus]|uniref:Carbohydrate-binding domain-containing protein n=1 Tax=Lacrimispora defluvii TaxID=2719233 RepID=A0ABX1VP60_9FIRM|nr:carbohydrate-binding domain-containing protein [Lacrimispora defluvii]